MLRESALTLESPPYQFGWTQTNFGRAAAVAWLLVLIIIVSALVNFLVTRRIASKGPR